jgi:spore maturation protein CgeB
MLILYVAMKHDYGKPEQGHSFEHWNFYDALVRMGHAILYFDFPTLLARHGRAGMNRRLVEVARAERPAFMFTVLFRDEFEPRALRRVSEAGGTATLNWFCDDQWRFDDFSRHWAPCFDWVVTTAAAAVPKYEALGVRHVIKSEWACNQFLYTRRPDLPMKHDLSFVGQPHGQRRAIIEALRAAGLEVAVWGQGWESGRLSQEAMIDLFNQSRINLNLANVSSAPGAHASRGRARRVVSAALRRLPGGARLLRLGPGLRPAPAAPPPPGLDEDLTAGALPGQLKGRNFEVPGCGGFLLTDPAEDLERYYEPGRELATFRTVRELIDKARHYLGHEEERRAIAEAGRTRTLREHTYVHRFGAIFDAIGLPSQQPEAILAAPQALGETMEIR